MTLHVPEIPTAVTYPVLRRIWAIASRHFYLYRGSWPRLVEMMYWPMLEMALYGFVSLSLVRSIGHATVLTTAYLCGVMLGEIFLRTIMATMVMYMEEVWSRNLGHLFASPIRLRDYVGSLMILSAARCFIAVIPAFFVVYLMFDFSILSLGWYLPVYAILLWLNGSWCGIMIISMLMRFGAAAEWLGWMCAWSLMPFMAPYYPVSTLPPALQSISWLLPGTYIFESMKYQIANGVPQLHYLAMGLMLDIGYFALAAFIFTMAYRSAKRLGGLLQMGE